MKRVPKTRVNVSEQKQKNRSTIYSSFDATNQRISTIFSRLVIIVVVVMADKQILCLNMSLFVSKLQNLVLVSLDLLDRIILQKGASKSTFLILTSNSDITKTIKQIHSHDKQNKFDFLVLCDN